MRQGPRLTPPGILVASQHSLKFVSPSRISRGIQLLLVLVGVFAYLGGLALIGNGFPGLSLALFLTLFVGFFPFLIITAYLSERVALWHPAFVHGIQVLEMLPKGANLVVLMDGERYVLTFDVPRSTVLSWVEKTSESIPATHG